MQVELFKQKGKYVDKKDGKEKPFINFFLRCGDELVPVDVRFFPQEKFDGRDPNYNGRKKVLSAFAAILPDKPDSDRTAAATGQSESNTLPF